VLVKSFKIFAILAIALASSLSAATIGLWSTGICSGLNTINCQGGAGSLLNYGATDNNYVFSGFSATNISEHAFSTYVADGAGASEWLTPGTVAMATFPAGSYTVTTTFNLAGFDPNSLTLFLDIAADNEVVASLNGHQILNCGTGTGSPPSGSACFTGFTSNHNITAGAMGFALPGSNTLSFLVYNEPGAGNVNTPTALRVQVQGNANVLSAVPEPGTLVLLGAGLAGLGLLRRKRA